LLFLKYKNIQFKQIGKKDTVSFLEIN